MTTRIGLLGGAFDPPHNAHLIMARTASRALGLDRVLLLPSPHPPHKAEDALLDYRHRLAMTTLAAEGVEGVEVSRLEEEGGGVSYTADLLERCRGRFGDDLYFIIGADSLRDLPRWRDPERVAALCTLVVFPRAGIPMWCAVGGAVSLVMFEAPVIDLSSTDVREMVAEGRAFEDSVPDPVATYIRRHSLYTRA